ncbi:NTP transferase domain-containing protein [Arcicella rosea]|uniref:Probable molybdenum cofactor guanylyltransferase n=1 Tax=Arcicella rosea TaxID=502909 RepID=A0A841EWK9_9BACT|nr:NTP transferase domain-containing protein [Arcicella rosea]MBB6005008.1 molybdopterin-guanine dinucleotide biosynthesis protein A [Arcicella rosea]
MTQIQNPKSESSELRAHSYKLNALILSGGKSTRMGTEKRLLNYHGKTQEQYLYDLLKPFCNEVFVSINANQKTELPYIQDLELSVKSPIVGIYSAFQQFPDTAWLVLACDMPLVSEETIEFLINNRNPEKYATAFENPEEHFPEPLLTIFEAKFFEPLQVFIQQEKKSTMRLLQSLDIALLQVPDAKMLKNINTVEEFRSFQL